MAVPRFRNAVPHNLQPIAAGVFGLLVVISGSLGQAAEMPFFSENFSKVDRGKLPEGWRGETMLAKGGSLVIFKSGDTHTLHGPEVKFPKNFRLEWTIRTIEVGKFSFGSASYDMHIGNATASLFTKATGINGSKSHVTVNETTRELASPAVDYTTVQLTLEKRDDVFTLLVNGKEAAVARHEDFKHDDTFTLQVRFQGLERSRGQFQVLKVVGRELKGR